MNANGDGQLRFRDFELDPHSGQLLRNGEPIRIQPQPLRVLRVLLEHAGRTVTREELRDHIWGDATYVEFDQGLNYCIRQIRRALHDDALNPAYIETLPKQGYRFIAEVTTISSNGSEHLALPPVAPPSTPDSAPLVSPLTLPRRRSRWLLAAAVCAGVLIVALVGLVLRSSFRHTPAALRYTQLTNFTDSAVAPALSSDGRMLAFFRGDKPFLTANQLYVKILPSGEPRRLTSDSQLKYDPAFSSDGSQITYSVYDGRRFSTYIVPVLGGEPRLLLRNAAGLTLFGASRVLFSRTRGSGVHMGIVSGTLSGPHFHELYFPANDRAMAHYSYRSPDQKAALIVEMDEQGHWAPCRLISLENLFPPRQIGSLGFCTSAAWSPDGAWMYFTIGVKGEQHIWRQHYPNGNPEQLTFGPAQEEGVAVEPDGRSLVTSLGVRQSSLWLHDQNGDRALAQEGEILGWPHGGENYPPSFSANGNYIYYLMRQISGSQTELWRVNVSSGKTEVVLPGVPMFEYDVSRDDKRVLYSSSAPGGAAQLYIAAVDGSFPTKRLTVSGEFRPHFGPAGTILFERTENGFNYLEEIGQDGSGRHRVFPFPILDVMSVSPNRRWVLAGISVKGSGPEISALSLRGDPPRDICKYDCFSSWSPDGKRLRVSVKSASENNPGRSLVIPLGPDETLPSLPAGGLAPDSPPYTVPGSHSVGREEILPGNNPSQYAYLDTTVHRNIYRISLPQ